MKWKEFKTGDVLNFDSSNGIFHACNVTIDNKKTDENHPYVVRTSQNNGVRGYISEDESKLNPENTISFAQDTAQMFYQEEAYFTGNKVKVLSVKGHALTRSIALFLISCLNKAFSNFAWGSSYDTKLLQNVMLSLPVKTTLIPDFESLDILIGGGIDMSSIDTSSWKEFKLDELFEKIKTEKISGKANDFPTCRTDEYTIPLLTAGADNQGLARYAKKNQCPTILKNVISISANGANTGVTFYQNNEFAVLQDAYAIKLKDIEIPNEQVGLFLASCISKILHGNFSWTYKAGWERIKDLSIKLPVKESEEIDWDYMQERIAELEQERIAELEQYLIATGLNDYELTDEDKEILATKLTDGRALQNSTSVNGCLKEARMFRVGDLFEKPDLKWKARRKFNKQKDISQIQTKEYNLPLVNAKNGSNGIMYYGRKDDFPYVNGGIDIVNDGAVSAGNVYPQPHEIGVLYNAYIIVLKNKKSNRLLDEYFACSLEKAIKEKFSYSNKAGWDKVKKCIFTVPIQTDSQHNPIIDSAHTYHPQGFIPDWEYMEKYIKATEKVVIRDVVEWKNEMIKKTKEVVEEVHMLKNKEYISMSDVINHDQNLKKLEDDIESTLKKQGVSIDSKTHLNIQRMTILVGNYCLDNTQDIYIPKEAPCDIEQVKFNEDQSHAEIIFKTNSAICKKDGLDTLFAIVFDAADRDEEPSLKYQTKVFKVMIGMNMEYVLTDEVKDLNAILFPGTLKIAGYEL